MGFFSDIGDKFSKNGSITKFCEQIPVVGHVTAGIQAIAGNGEEAKRALATSTGNLCSTVGAVGGFMVGGPPGAVAGGALGGLAGTFVENGISKTIDDPNVKGDVGDVTLQKVVMNVGLGGATASMGGAGKGLASAGSKAILQSTVKGAALAGTTTALGSGFKSMNPSQPKPSLGDQDPEPKPETKKYISQINKTKIDALAQFLLDMAQKYPVTPISGPCVNTGPALQGMIFVGQLWYLGSAIYTDQLVYFDDRFFVGAQFSQGGIEQALIDLCAPTRNVPFSIIENGVAVVYTEQEIQTKLTADRAEMLQLRSVANHSLEFEFDEH